MGAMAFMDDRGTKEPWRVVAARPFGYLSFWDQALHIVISTVYVHVYVYI